MKGFDRCWFLTWTAYGSWLPGDERGIVSTVRLPDRTRTIHNRPGTEYDCDRPRLKDFSADRLESSAVRLTREQAAVASKQFRSTAAHRSWAILAVAVMSNHVHVVIGVVGDPKPNDILRDLKSYASRELNRRWSPKSARRWRTESGSTRKLPDEAAILSAIRYTKNQQYPLALWIASELLNEC